MVILVLGEREREREKEWLQIRLYHLVQSETFTHFVLNIYIYISKDGIYKSIFYS